MENINYTTKKPKLTAINMIQNDVVHRLRPQMQAGLYKQLCNILKQTQSLIDDALRRKYKT